MSDTFQCGHPRSEANNAPATKPRSNHRPMPADFPEKVAELSHQALLKAHYRCGLAAIQRWLAEMGVPRARPKLKCTDDEFREAARTMTRQQLAAHFRIGANQVRTLVSRTGAQPVQARFSPPPKYRAIPEDFAENARTMTRNQLAVHYVAGWITVNRWLAEMGIAPVTVQAMPPKPRPAKVQAPRSAAALPTVLHRKIAPTRTTTIYDDAADLIRRDMPVYRCTDKGRADHKGSFWRAGNTVLTPAELLIRADRKRSRAA